MGALRTSRPPIPALLRSVLDCLICQTGGTPFNPRDAVKKFAEMLREYGVSRVTGDAYAGQTFRADFETHRIAYEKSLRAKHDIYDAFEPILNAGEVELLDHPKMTEQLLTLVFRGGKIDHQPGDHDDHANAACGAIMLAAGTQAVKIPIVQPYVWSAGPADFRAINHKDPRW